MGGYSVDRFGPGRVIMISIIVQAASLLFLSIFGHIMIVGILLIGIMMMSLFVGIPAVQSYFIQKAPSSSNLVLSINTSVVHLGLAAGAGTGGILVETSSTLSFHPLLASSMIVLAMIAAVISMRESRKKRISYLAS
ncbi:hypothetical protein NV379_14015 [Paenibacillus sp. N1-5-1-14]|uniref:MFS transporter n=1 Tax=Paenibacillus radicibacter TaxID=2972488 RepID=UPI0021597F5A|nr:MFS transporter [Paenibacillus radicibacter]MCR8643767.1 hypothetical protein [Paenibacillus radicibacter]